MSRHTIAIFDADGQMHRVHADEIRMCAPTAKCIRFWVQTFSCLLAMALGVFFMIWQGAQSVYFNIGESLLALGIGILIPSPKYEHVLPKSITSRPGSPERNVGAEREPRSLDENTESGDTGKGVSA